MIITISGLNKECDAISLEIISHLRRLGLEVHTKCETNPVLGDHIHKLTHMKQEGFPISVEVDKV